MAITYIHQPNAATVKLDGKVVGKIAHTPHQGGGWTYWPKGSKTHGEVFKTVHEVKRSLEEEESEEASRPPKVIGGPIGDGTEATEDYLIARLTSPELAAILTGLRLLQKSELDIYLMDIATNGGEFQPLDNSQIDELCERLNCGE